MSEINIKRQLLANLHWYDVPEDRINEVLDILGIKFPSSDKTSTKQCPNCGNTHLLLLHTSNKKICTDCDTVIPWTLDKSQKPLL